MVFKTLFRSWTRQNRSPRSPEAHQRGNEGSLGRAWSHLQSSRAFQARRSVDCQGRQVQRRALLDRKGRGKLHVDGVGARDSPRTGHPWRWHCQVILFYVTFIGVRFLHLRSDFLWVCITVIYIIKLLPFAFQVWSCEEEGLRQVSHEPGEPEPGASLRPRAQDLRKLHQALPEKLLRRNQVSSIHSTLYGTNKVFRISDIKM